MVLGIRQIKKEINRENSQDAMYICDSPNYLARQCKQGKTESAGKKTTQNQTSKSNGTRVIRTGSNMTVIKRRCCCVKVMMEGVAVSGLIETGSDNYYNYNWVFKKLKI